jgi:hypothetical protein
MGMPNITGDIIAQGYNCQVRVGTNASDAKPIALVSSFQANENFSVQKATVVGNLGPVSIDPQDYDCTVQLNNFVPHKKILDGVQQYADGGKVSIFDIIPTRAQFMDSGAISKVAYMDFYNRKAGKVLSSFEGLVVTTDGLQVDGSGYVRGNVSLMALSKN